MDNPITNQVLSVVGIAFFAGGMFDLFRHIYIEQSSVRGIAQIVSKHFKDDHSGKANPRLDRIS